MRPLCCITLAITLTLANAASADTITLKSGDHLNGTLTQISSGIVSFRTEFAGLIMVPHDEVAALNTTSKLIIALRDERLKPGHIQTHDHEFYVTSPDGQIPTRLNLARIQDIENFPSDAPQAEKFSDTLSASIETGYQLRFGTRDASGPTLDLEVQHESKRMITRLHTAFEYTEDADDFDRFMTGELSLISNTSKTLRPTIFFEAERDRNRAIDYRFEAAVGVTSKLVYDVPYTLEGFAGVGGTIERFDPDPLRADLGADNTIRASAQPQRRDELNLDLRVRYSRDILRRTTITEQLILKPSLTQLGYMRTEIGSSILVPVSYNLKLHFDLLFDFDNDSRYSDIRTWNTAIGAGLRLDF